MFRLLLSPMEPMPREEQIRLITESTYRINSQLPDEVRMPIKADPVILFTISEATKKLDICTDVERFKEDMKTFHKEMRIILMVAEKAGVVRGRDFCENKQGTTDNAYCSALDRMVYHGILVMTSEPPEETIQLSSDRDSGNRRGASKCIIFGAALLCLALIVFAAILYLTMRG